MSCLILIFYFCFYMIKASFCALYEKLRFLFSFLLPCNLFTDLVYMQLQGRLSYLKAVMKDIVNKSKFLYNNNIGRPTIYVFIKKSS